MIPILKSIKNSNSQSQYLKTKDKFYEFILHPLNLSQNNFNLKYQLLLAPTVAGRFFCYSGFLNEVRYRRQLAIHFSEKETSMPYALCP